MHATSDKHASFRRLFASLDVDGDGVVQRKELIAAAQSSLAGVFAAAFAALDDDGDGTLSWDELRAFLARMPEAPDDGLDTQGLFALIDRDGSGTITAQELLHVLTALDPEFTLAGAEAMVREFDHDGNGTIDLKEFTSCLDDLRAHPPAPQTDASPHIVLNMDVNNTVIMFDSATGADARALISMVLANAAWGTIDASGERWTPASREPSVVAPGRDLVTYTSFVVRRIPMTGDVQEQKRRRRDMLREFVSVGQAGEVYLPFAERLIAALELPAAVRGGELARAAGLAGGTVLLLPSFMRLLWRLASEGRSFTVVFRTFGHDLGALAAEYNALWEARHPLFPLQGEPGAVVRDGSQGGPDMRMRLHSVDGCGTYHRVGVGAGEEHLSLVMGTIEQPEHATAEGRASYERRIAEGEPWRLIRGSGAISEFLAEQTRRPQTLALRDFYQGWEQAECKAPGGKPLLVEDDAADVLQVFFDDHILPVDAKIVDARRARADAPMLPAAAVYGTHLIRAEPLSSIGEPDYFYDALVDAEKRWRARGARRRLLARALGDLEHMREALAALAGRGPATDFSYTSHQQSDAVTLTSSTATFEDVP